MRTVTVTTPNPTEIAMTRVFDAPRRLVAKAMSTPELIKKWLGNSRAAVTTVEVDYRVGGRYLYRFRRPDGGEFSFTGEFHEISEERVVYTEWFNDMPPGARITSTLTEDGGKTTLHVVMAFPSQEIRDMVLATGMDDGAGESYDNLDALVRSL
jgi:uncharacterized protein YndB with AHSA1/START domain